MITHEYYTYGTYAFIPDIGGYLVGHPWLRFKSIFISMYNILQGLCLGASLLSFYDLTLEVSSRAMNYMRKIKGRKSLTDKVGKNESVASNFLSHSVSCTGKET